MHAAIPRSALYMPGINQRAMDKARELPCDAVIFDLEDAVPPERKQEARGLVLAQLAAGGYGDRMLVVRANGLGSPWGEEDLHALGAEGVERVCLPKVSGSPDLQRAFTLLQHAGASKTLKLWAMVETPEGVSRVEEICAFERLEMLVMGTTDLANELRVPHRPDRLGLQYALSRCVNAARARRVAVLDGVFLDIGDEAGLAAVCEQGRALGFDGKTLIHPAQIAAANTAFGVSEEDVARARRVVEAWEKAEAEGKAVALLDGSLLEAMHVEDARRILSLAR
ncbi:MAG: CoA ester lyase [Halieaceae bacterium]|nr:CoA ester lyase [Halieaceae bacterium]